MSQILLNLQSQAADVSPVSFADIVGLSGSATVNSADSVILLIANIPQKLETSADVSFDLRFEIDGVLVGPVLCYYKDGVNRGCGSSICFAVTLTAASHDFAIQWQTRFRQAAIAEDRVRSFQVIEITDATILADTGDITSADAATSGFSDVADMIVTGSVTTGATQLILSNMQPDDSGTDCVSIFRLAIDDVGVGLEHPIFGDSQHFVCGSSIMWMVDGLTGSTKFALQWDEVQTSMIADTGRIRRLQVIEITANVNLPFTPVLTNAVQVITPGYADVTDLTSSLFTPNSADSILLFAAGVAPNNANDNVSFYRFYDGDTGEGPEMHCFGDSPSNQESCGHTLYWATTGKTGAHTFTVRGESVQIDLNTVTLGDYTNGFGILELLAAGGEILQVGSTIAASSTVGGKITGKIFLDSIVRAQSSVFAAMGKTLGIRAILKLWSKISGTLLIHRPTQPRVGIVVVVSNESGPQQNISRSDSFQHTVKRELSSPQYTIRRK